MAKSAPPKALRLATGASPRAPNGQVSGRAVARAEHQTGTSSLTDRDQRGRAMNVPAGPRTRVHEPRTGRTAPPALSRSAKLVASRIMVNPRIRGLTASHHPQLLQKRI